MEKSDLKIHEVDLGVLHGELYLNDQGEGSFICHTPPDMSADESRAALIKFMRLLLDKLNHEKWCPILGTVKDEDYP